MLKVYKIHLLHLAFSIFGSFDRVVLTKAVTSVHNLAQECGDIDSASIVHQIGCVAILYLERYYGARQ